MSAQLTHEGTRIRMTQPTGSAVTGRLRSAWHQIRLTVAEMNYGARRIVELQAPWAIDEQSHTR
jgi:hypothetical protein